MKLRAMCRVAVVMVVAAGGGPLRGVGISAWPVEELRNWENPRGPAYQPYFLLNGGTRMMFLWPDGPVVIPMEEIAGGRYLEGRLLQQPLTVNPGVVGERVVPVAESGEQVVPAAEGPLVPGPSGVGGHGLLEPAVPVVVAGSSGGPGLLFPPQAPAAVAVPEAGAGALLMEGLGLVLGGIWAARQFGAA